MNKTQKTTAPKFYHNYRITKDLGNDSAKSKRNHNILGLPE